MLWAVQRVNVIRDKSAWKVWLNIIRHSVTPASELHVFLMWHSVDVRTLGIDDFLNRLGLSRHHRKHLQRVDKTQKVFLIVNASTLDMRKKSSNNRNPTETLRNSVVFKCLGQCLFHFFFTVGFFFGLCFLFCIFTCKLSTWFGMISLLIWLVQ